MTGAVGVFSADRGIHARDSFERVGLLANAGLIPPVSNAPPLYGYLIAVGAPVAIFLLLLDVLLSALMRAGLPMLVAFGIGSLGTLVGARRALGLFRRTSGQTGPTARTRRRRAIRIAIPRRCC